VAGNGSVSRFRATQGGVGGGGGSSMVEDGPDRAARTETLLKLEPNTGGLA